jgi:hypothetical protein
VTLNKINFVLPPSPSAAGGTGRPAEMGGGENRAAWLREMERQEMASWLNHGPLPAAQREQRVSAPAAQALRSLEAIEPAADGMPEDPQSADTVTRALQPGGAESTAAGARAAEGIGSDAALEQRPAKASHEAPGAQAPAAHARAVAPAQMSEQDLARQAFVQKVMSQLNEDPKPGAALALQPAVVQADASEPAASAAPAAGPGYRAASPSWNGTAAQPRQMDLEPVRADEPDVTVAAKPNASPLQDRAGEPAPAVRVHSFWSDEAVRVWVGTDRSAALSEQQLAGALQDLKRLLRQQGATLASLTVNGETVLDTEEAAGAPVRELEPVRIQGLQQQRE